MAGGEDWDHEKMLDLYVHGYLLKKNFRRTADIFRKEANVPRTPVALSGLLNEWFAVVYDMIQSRQHQQVARENPPDMGEDIKLAPLPPSLTFSPDDSPQQQQNWNQDQQLVARVWSNV